MPPARRVLLLLLPALTACGESWTWNVAAGGVDSASPATDLDGDGYPNLVAGGTDCWDDPRTIPPEYAAISGAAQPAAADVHPGAVEAWYDGVDQDCANDDDFDQDGDGHRSSTHADASAAFGDDCFDGASDTYPVGLSSCTGEAQLTPGEVHPGATDVWYDGTDADCSGNDDFDQDGDGFGRCAECDDTNASIFPNDEPEVWYDGVDANCDGNDGDQDGDGYYALGYAYAVPPDFEAGDCADDPAVLGAALNGFADVEPGATHPGATETWYDGIDQDCAADADFDQDRDGQATSAWPDEHDVTGPDCLDTDASVYVGAPDAWYDGADSDCGGNDDYDQDGDGVDADGYGTGGDCDDTNAAIGPFVAEDCATSADDDCDGDTNDLDALGCVAWYEDGDVDGYGGAEACLCAATAAYSVAAGGDCDDVDAAVNPGEAEVCNDGVDNDCDGGAGGCGPVSGSASTALKYSGEASPDWAGHSVAAGGDVDGDGYDDFAVGAVYNSDGASMAGAVYVVLGGASPSSGSLSTSLEYTGEAEGDGAGLSVAGTGDLNGDGYGDILVGARANDDGGSFAGAAYLILGAATPSSGSLSDAVQYTGAGAGDAAGTAVGGAGDVDGDGLSDMIVGASWASGGGGYSGAAYLIFGTLTPSDASVTIGVTYEGENTGDYLGQAVSGAGDVDGDGYDDVLIGAYGADIGTGKAYLVLGGLAASSSSLTGAVIFSGEAWDDGAGISVASAGDVNGDGYSDVVIGAYGNDDAGVDAGTAYLVLGSGTPNSDSLSSAVEYMGEATGDGAGRSVAAAGDVDGDGQGDLVVGAHYNSDGGTNAGAAYLVLGTVSPSSHSLSSDIEISGERASDDLGSSVSSGGDVDADGHDDLVVGARFETTGGARAGAAYLILGQGL